MKYLAPLAISCITLISQASAQASVEANSPTAKKAAPATAKGYSKTLLALNKAFDSGNVDDVWDYVSPDFEITGCPPREYLTGLHKAFQQTKGKVSDATVVKSTATEIGMTLMLKAKQGMSFDVGVDEDGLLTSISFIRLKVSPEAELQISAPPVSDIALVAHGGLKLIKGKVQGKEGYWLVDTGAPMCVLNADEFPDLKGKAVGLQGIGGDVRSSSFVNIQSLQFGEVSITQPRVLHQSLKSILTGRKKITLLGIIGYREFKEFEMIFDYPNNSLCLVKLDKDGKPLAKTDLATPKHMFRFKLASHLPVINCELNGQRLRLGFDSGAEANVLSTKYKESLSPLLINKSTKIHSGGDGRFALATLGEFPTFNVEGQSYKNLKAIFTNIDHLNQGESGMKIDGLIGSDFITKANRFSLNLKKREIKIW